MTDSKWRVVTVDNRTQHRHETTFRFSEAEAQQQADKAAALGFCEAWTEKKGAS